MSGSNGNQNLALELEKLREEIIAGRDLTRPILTVCAGTGCCASGALDVRDALEAQIKEQGVDTQVELKITGCRGFCEQGPLVAVLPKHVFYTKVKAKDAAEIVRKTIVNGEVVDRLLFKDPVTGQRLVHETDIPFYKEQQRVLLKDSGYINPTLIEDYLAVGGYQALPKALLDMTPDAVIAEVKKSGLRGRGGAGFPAGVKWELARKAPGDEKYVICNADEGDPGAFQDRSLIEANPHSVLEGIIIGGYAIGANKGYIYLRHEYPLAVERMEIAVKVAREHGLLGKNILGSDFDFDIFVQLGAGAFVCGEETALMASIEGKVGEPRSRPPYPAQKGLWGKPTNINNVKTWASVPYIIKNGADWYNQIGTSTSKGTTVFSLVGKVKNTGLIEVPLGITLRDLIEKIGGGASSDLPLKAVQTGGPSGGCIPESLWHLPVDYESLKSAGSMMGSGGMIVMDESTCMVDMARYFLEFSRYESCGKCSACREGVRRMHEILEYITKGLGQEGDIELLEELGHSVQLGALCALGQTAPNPVLTMVKYFREEYETHIRDHKCPAGVCKELIEFYIFAENCNGCGLCARSCPNEAISGERKQVHVIDSEVCIRCGMCREVCNQHAVFTR